jgi:rare lipoprotein A
VKFGRWLSPLVLLAALAACGGHQVRVLDEPSVYKRPTSPPPVSRQPGPAAPLPAPPPKTPDRPLRPWEKPYVVNGERFDPLLDHQGFVEEGIASWYGADFHGKKTSNGEIYDMHALTAAHKTLPLGVWVRVRNLKSGQEQVLRVNDRGPFVAGRIIDLSYAGAQALGLVGPGTAPVRVEALGFQATDSAGRISYQAPARYDLGNFSIQVGAFTLAANARKMAAEMESRHGFANVQTGMVNGTLFHRVRAGKYGSLAEAEQARLAFDGQGYRNCFVVALD